MKIFTKFFLLLFLFFLVACSENSIQIPENNSENQEKITENSYENFLQKSLSEADLSDDEIFSRNGGDFFPITILTENNSENIRLTRFSGLENFLKNSKNIAGIRFWVDTETHKFYTSEEFLKIILSFVENGNLSLHFLIEWKLQSELLQNEENLSQIAKLPVNFLKIFRYDNDLRLSEKHTEILKNSEISLINIANYTSCTLDENNENGVIYVENSPKIFCYLQQDIRLPILFQSDATGKKTINPDYLAEILTTVKKLENVKMTVNNEEKTFEDFEKMNFENVKNLKIHLPDGHSREYLAAVLHRLSRQSFDRIFIAFSFEHFDNEILEMMTLLETKNLSLDIFDAYNWRIPKFVISENFVKIFQQKFEFFGIVTSTGMGGISEIFFENNGREVLKIGEKMWSTTVLWQYENFESEENKNFSKKFHGE